MALVSVGLILLWLAFPVVGWFEGGDCVSDAAAAPCELVWAAGQTHVRVFLAIGVAVTLLAVLALVRGRRMLPALLLVAAVATVVIAWASMAVPATSGIHGPLPNALITVMPGAGLIVAGALWQLARYRTPSVVLPGR